MLRERHAEQTSVRRYLRRRHWFGMFWVCKW